MREVIIRDDVVALDLDGDLDTALARSRILLWQAGESGDLRRRIEALLVLARVLRHRDDPASLHEAMSAAMIAARLTLLPSVGERDLLHGHAELECAACLVRGGRAKEGSERAWPWRDRPEPWLAGRAWVVIGDALRAEERPSAAVAALANAVAEFQRGQGEDKLARTKIRLAEALSSGGHVAAAAAVLDELREWCASDPPCRLRIAYYLALAEVRQAQGDVEVALDVLAEQAWPVLRSRKSLVALRIRYHLQCAAYLRMWGQKKASDSHANRAAELRRRLPLGRPVDVHELASVPRRTGTDFLSAHSVVFERDIAGEVAQALKGTREDDHARRVVELLELLQGRPDAERAELSLLIETGERLAPPKVPSSLSAERCLRRALVRIAWLPGMELWRARGQVALARMLADTGRVDEALELALRAVRTFDDQRLRMRERSWRGNWLGASIHPAFELAVELAVRCDRPEIASDLIVFSRAAGVVATSGSPDRPSGQRLLPVPRLHYIDGSTSVLGSGAECRMI